MWDPHMLGKVCTPHFFKTNLFNVSSYEGDVAGLVGTFSKNIGQRMPLEKGTSEL